MQQSTILVVEDDTDLSGLIKDYLISDGYQVETVFDGAKVVETAKSVQPTLIILDIMLPGLNGIEICKQLRTFTFCPILIISAKNSDADKLLSFGVGADDYLTKPFSFVEMLGRVKSHIRRYTSFQKDVNTKAEKVKKIFGEITIDPITFAVNLKDQKVQMTAKEFRLLDFLSSHPGQVFSKEQLLDAVWGEDAYLDDNTVAVYIGRLREKLFQDRECYIKTVWGLGYMWEQTDLEA